MTKSVVAQINSTHFELLDHHFSLCHTDYSKNNNFGIENPGIFNTNPRIKKGNMFFKQHCSRIKKMFFSFYPNAVCFYTGFENYDMLIEVFKYLESKASRMHFWPVIGQCNDVALKYQNENISKPGRKRKFSLLEVFCFLSQT